MHLIHDLNHVSLRGGVSQFRMEYPHPPSHYILGLGRGGWGLMVLQVFLSLGVWGIRGFGIQQDPSELISYAPPVGPHFCHSATVGAQICPESEL